MMTTIVRQQPTKQTNNIIEHDISCVVDTNKGQKEGVDINDEGGKEVDKEFDIDSLYNQDYDYTDLDGTVDGTDNVMIALENVCVDDRKSEGNREIKNNNDDYNNDDGCENIQMLFTVQVTQYSVGLVRVLCAYWVFYFMLLGSLSEFPLLQF